MKVPGIVQKAMDRLGALTGRKYQFFRYAGHLQPERVVVAIGSADRHGRTEALLAKKTKGSKRITVGEDKTYDSCRNAPHECYATQCAEAG